MESSNLSEAYPMNGGHGLHSYVTNSTYQRAVTEATKELINEAIAENFNMDIICSSFNKTLRITDMGCSVGPNTFVAVENIIEAVQNNKTYKSQVEEFQVFFNDHVSNDFNTLFASLPSNRKYYATGVPGSFYSRLFPAASIHIVHSSYALQWLSEVPKDNNSPGPGWNKGRIYYSSAGDDVIKAYAHQFGQDMNKFLHCRAQEIVPGGLLLLTFPGRLNRTPHSQVFSNVSYDLLGACLMEMAKKGIITEEKVDSFNIPIYFTSPQEVEEAVKFNGSFSLQSVVCIPVKKAQDSIPLAEVIASHMRAGFQNLLKEHFGPEILDHLFHSFVKQLEISDLSQFGVAFSFFLVLKRKLSV